MSITAKMRVTHSDGGLLRLRAAGPTGDEYESASATTKEARAAMDNPHRGECHLKPTREDEPFPTFPVGADVTVTIG